MKAIIGGTGVYGTSHNSRREKVNTRYGQVEFDLVNIDGQDIVFLARHGRDHSTPPHLINYKANMMALKEYGVRHIYATAAVGSMNPNYGPGDVVIIKDYLDLTKLRPVTYFEGGDQPVKHVDMSDPYCKNMREKFGKGAQELDLTIKGDAVYICTEGPRFETASEINMYKNYGDVVGMTTVPEVIFAKELGMCYSTIGIITNWCTGLSGEIALHDIEGSVDKNREKINDIFIKVFKEGLDQNNCNCHDSIIEL